MSLNPHYRPRSGDCGLDPGSKYTPDEVEFMVAMDRYKRQARRPYPDAVDVLAVARSLGYRRVTLQPPRDR